MTFLLRQSFYSCGGVKQRLRDRKRDAVKVSAAALKTAPINRLLSL
jgi:hypothetical protein